MPGEKWTKDELLEVYHLWKNGNQEKIHKGNKEIQNLGKKLNRKTRAVEAQMIMFRALQRGGDYSRANMSKICIEIWNENEMTLEDDKPEENMSRERKIIKYIASRSFGGDDSTVVPSVDMGLMDEFEGVYPAGVKDVMEQFVESITSNNETIEWIFMIGGPGNGKSYQAGRLLNDLGIDIEVKGIGGTAERSYSSAEAKVKVINDATIRTHTGTDSPNDLAIDLRESLETLKNDKLYLMANINRGILIEEKHALEENKKWLVEYEIINCLLGLEFEDLQFLELVHNDTDSAYFNRYKMVKDTQGLKYDLYLNLVYLDKLSLLELTPSLTNEDGSIKFIDNGDNVEVAPCKIMNYDSEDRVNTPFGLLLNEIINSLLDCDGFASNEFCPFYSNVKSLSNTQLRLNLLNFLRASEIASGKIYSYREIWHLISFFILGPYVEEWNTKHPSDWVTANKKNYLELFMQRYGTSLCNEENVPDVLKEYVSNKVIRRYPLVLDNIIRIEPARDTSADWATKVNEAIEGIKFDKMLCNDVLINNDDYFKLYWNKLDKRVEEEIVLKNFNSLGTQTKDKSLLLSWYARIIYRAFGISTGNYGHKDVIDHWLQLVKTKNINDQSNKIAIGLKSMLKMGIDGQQFLPIFHPRTEPLKSFQNTAVWCVGYESEILKLKFKLNGDLLILELIIENTSLADVVIDFDVAREAFMHNPSYGFTENGGTIMPRVERAHSAILAMQNDLINTYLISNDQTLIHFD
tara:strand:+ start:588 stop:2834 length:2247 start_codon:yes stop_codon:yes gene_type:complete